MALRRILATLPSFVHFPCSRPGTSDADDPMIHRMKVDSIAQGRFDSFLEIWFGLAKPSVLEIAQARTLCQPPPSCFRCGQALGPGEGTKSGCGACRNTSAVLDGVVCLGAFEGLLAATIKALKYERRWELARPLGVHLARALEPLTRAHAPQEWLIIPMPMPFLRRVQRGVDHAGLLASSTASSLGVKLVQPLRKSSGVPQAGRSRTDRRRAPRRDYRLVRGGISGFGGKLPNMAAKRLILVDDVLTTGRSMSAAGSALRRLGPASIHAAVLAVSTNRSTTADPGDPVP